MGLGGARSVVCDLFPLALKPRAILVIFIRDNKKEKIRSYIIERDETIQLDPSRITFSDLSANKPRKKKKKRKKKRR